MKRHTRIIATLGPASFNEPMLSKMASRGMNVVRINCSHGTDEQHKAMIDLVRKINKQKGYKIKILLDLAGYRIRVGDLKKRKPLEVNQIVYMSYGKEQGENHIPFDFEGNIKNIKKGMFVFIDDGRLNLKVIGNSGKKLKLKVLQGGILKERKGVNIPALKLHNDIMTQQDKEDIMFGLKHKVDIIAQSFVRNREDIERVKDMVKPTLPYCKIIAKIESEEGITNIDSIVDACDGIMVARGDLGVTMPLYKIPVIQKYLIRHCNRRKKLSFVATQMLESMIENGRPTRAEVSDVANAILDGGDYVMLSGETATGKYPSRSVQFMSQIIEFTEKYVDYKP